MKVVLKKAPSYEAAIHMAGDIAVASMICQRYAAKKGMCISISDQHYIYTGGCERGFKVVFINYPRFTLEPDEILKNAENLAEHLVVELGQASYTITTPDITIWYSRRESMGGNREHR